MLYFRQFTWKKLCTDYTSLKSNFLVLSHYIDLFLDPDNNYLRIKIQTVYFCSFKALLFRWEYSHLQPRVRYTVTWVCDWWWWNVRKWTKVETIAHRRKFRAVPKKTFSIERVRIINIPNQEKKKTTQKKNQNKFQKNFIDLLKTVI